MSTLPGCHSHHTAWVPFSPCRASQPSSNTGCDDKFEPPQGKGIEGEDHHSLRESNQYSADVALSPSNSPRSACSRGIQCGKDCVLLVCMASPVLGRSSSMQRGARMPPLQALLAKEGTSGQRSRQLSRMGSSRSSSKPNSSRISRRSRCSMRVCCMRGACSGNGA